MNDTTIILMTSVLVLSALGGGCVALMANQILSLRRSRRAREAHEPLTTSVLDDQPEESTARSLLEALVEGPVRYQISVGRWTPSTEGDDLPPYRWTVTDADWNARTLIEGHPAPVGSPLVPFMLGNTDTPDAALLAAVTWVEQQRHPVYAVVL